MGFFDAFKSSVGVTSGRILSEKLFGDGSHHQKHLEMMEKQNELTSMNKQIDSVEDKIQQLSTLCIPNNRDELIAVLNQLGFLLQTYKVKDDSDDKNKIDNKYSDAVLAKYKQALNMFIALYPNDMLTPHYEQILKSSTRLRFVRKHLFISILFAVIVTGILIAAIASAIQ